MPIAQLKPTTAVPVIQNNEPQIQPDTYCSTTVDAQKNTLTSLLAYVQGMPWAVNYYQQVITTESDLKEQDIGEVPVYQQYEKINGLELRVTSAIEGQQNTDKAQMRVSGNALVYPFMTPQVGDMFVADAGYGEQGIYVIDSVERKSFNLNTVYSISYHLRTFTSQDPAMLTDLDTKAIRQTYFDKTRLVQGLAPVLNSQDYNNLQSLDASYKQLVDYFFNTFYNHNFDTLPIPGQSVGCYDAFLVDYILRIVDTTDSLKISNVRNYATDGEDFLQQPQFWSMMLARDYGMLPYINRYMGLVMTKFFNYNSMFKGIRYSRMTYIMYPVTADFSLINPNDQNSVGDPLLMDYGVQDVSSFSISPKFKPQALTQLQDVRSSGGSLTDILKNTVVAGTAPTNPIILPAINPDSSYVLSSEFYTGGTSQSLLESLVTAYLQKNPLNLNDLTTCIAPYRSWGRLEQFYYLPILITLIRTAQHEACTS